MYTGESSYAYHRLYNMDKTTSLLRG